MESFIKSGKQLLEKPMVRSWSPRHRGGARLSMRHLVMDDEVVGGTPKVIGVHGPPVPFIGCLPQSGISELDILQTQKTR